jgi:hypothetical protein
MWMSLCTQLPLAILTISQKDVNSENIQVHVVTMSYNSWISIYQCYHCLSPLNRWVRFQLMARCTLQLFLIHKVCQWPAGVGGFFLVLWFAPLITLIIQKYIWCIVESDVNHQYPIAPLLIVRFASAISWPEQNIFDDM